MCGIQPITEDRILGDRFPVGLQCPLCDGSSAVGFMKFLDPHGVERVDPDLLECANRLHSFVREAGTLRLLASEGTLARQKRAFGLREGKLAEL